MQTLIRDKMGLRYTVHGFRSSFMDWVAEVHPQRLLEAERALDHQIGNQVQRAYLRTDFLEQRRELAELWADHLQRGSSLLGSCLSGFRITPSTLGASIKLNPGARNTSSTDC